jgi:hypothetical protein
VTTGGSGSRRASHSRCVRDRLNPAIAVIRRLEVRTCKLSFTTRGKLISTWQKVCEGNFQ